MPLVEASALKIRRQEARAQPPGFDPAFPARDKRREAAAQEIDLRQLRHHTKNTLQRIIALISDMPGFSDTPEGAKIAQELEYRIGLSASVSDALFGLTNAPGTMADRLRQLAGAQVELMRDADQMIRVGVAVLGSCPVDVREAVMRGANELIGNAVKHGLKGRTSGRITVRLVTRGSLTTLTVIDNGWGFSGIPRRGEGLTLAEHFAEHYGGSLRLESMDGTIATLDLPH